MEFESILNREPVQINLDDVTGINPHIPGTVEIRMRGGKWEVVYGTLPEIVEKLAIGYASDEALWTEVTDRLRAQRDAEVANA